MRLVIDNKQFIKDMKNVTQYAEGFLSGAAFGKPVLMQNIGMTIKTLAYQYIDASASVNPSSLHHVYEWYQAGQANARLYEFSYIVNSAGVSFFSSMTQSKSVAKGATEPFYNKAMLMEKGSPITIFPKSSSVLAFESDGGTVFTRNPVTVAEPGGPDVEGSFNEIVDEFFSRYLAQSFLSASGLAEHLKNPQEFKTYFNTSKSGGKQAGFNAGKKWISRGAA
jgi:hypothetical protein